MAAKGLSRSKDLFVVLSTASSLRQARLLSQILLKAKLAGCINLLPKIDSWYWWKGRVEQGKEVLLLIKTSRSRLGELRRVLKRHHSYEVPELIALPIGWGDQVYLNWLRKNLG